MSTIYDKTDNYALNLYGDADPADLRDGYNGSMRTIDTTLETHLNRIEADEEVVKALLGGSNTVDNAAASKAKWDKAGTTAAAAIDKADNNNTCLANLQSNTPDKATATYNKITSNSNNISTLFTKVENRILKLDVSNILCIGDSFGDETAKGHGNWVQGLRTSLPNATIMNQCVSGSGYVRNFGVKFVQQINNAIAANFSADYIIIVGGVNDTDENLTNIISAVRDVCTLLQTSYPLAKILFVPMCAGYYHLTLKRRYVAMAMQNIISNYNFAYFRSAWTLNVNRREFVTDDNLHPTEAGAKNISDKILQWLIDGTVYMGPTTQITEQIISNGTGRMWVNNGTFYFALQGNVTDVDTAIKSIALPDQFASTNTCRMVTGYMANGTRPIAATYEIADNVQGATIKITTPLEAGQFQLDVSYDL